VKDTHLRSNEKPVLAQVQQLFFEIFAEWNANRDGGTNDSIGRRQFVGFVSRENHRKTNIVTVN